MCFFYSSPLITARSFRVNCLVQEDLVPLDDSLLLPRRQGFGDRARSSFGPRPQARSLSSEEVSGQPIN